jgi:putative ABC transport system permease protein
MSLPEIYLALEMGLIYGIVSLGLFLTFRVLDYSDLTVDGSFLVGAVLTAVLITRNVDPWFAVIWSMIGGGIAGLITAFLHLCCKISSLLSGIITAFMSYSICLRLMGEVPNISLISQQTIFTFYSEWGLLSVISLFIAGILFLLLLTDWGLALRSIGRNAKLARSYGVNVSLMLLIGLVLSNGLVGLAGGLFAQFQSFADISQGVGTVIFGLAGLVIGETLFSRRGLGLQILSCFLGSVFYRLLVALALHSDSLGLKSSDLNLLTGIALTFFMSWPLLKKKINRNA